MEQIYGIFQYNVLTSNIMFDIAYFNSCIFVSSFNTLFQLFELLFIFQLLPLLKIPSHLKYLRLQRVTSVGVIKNNFKCTWSCVNTGCELFIAVDCTCTWHGDTVNMSIKCIKADVTRVQPHWILGRNL